LLKVALHGGTMFIVRFKNRKGKCYVKNNDNHSISFVDKEDATKFKTRQEIDDLLQFFNDRYIEEV